VGWLVVSNWLDLGGIAQFPEVQVCGIEDRVVYFRTGPVTQLGGLRSRLT
jgi:hypothetical protein